MSKLANCIVVFLVAWLALPGSALAQSNTETEAEGKKTALSYLSQPDPGLLFDTALGFGYNDAEAGFKGLFLNARYPYSEKFSVIAESALLRGNDFNYSHTLIGATAPIPYLESLPLLLSGRAGLFHSSFQSDTETGLLLGARAFTKATPKIIVEAGADFVTAGENSFVLVAGAIYSLTDELSLQARYWLGDLDELTLSINYHF